MANEYINKVVNGETGDVLIDLTGDTLINASQLVSGIKAHARSGAVITGTNTNDANTSDANATASQILSGATAYVQGSKVTGTMTNNGAVSGTISTKAQQYTVPAGYHDGSGKVQIATAEQNKIIAGNIKQGVTVLGVTGTYSGEGVNLQSKTVTSSFTAQTVTADAGYDALSQVAVNAMPYSETDNSAGGKTVTIGAGA
jgi:hypothetical protein